MGNEKKSVYKPKPISGYPEWLPEIRYVEQQWFDHIRGVFESYGFCSIETPSVEELDVIRAKGEVDKEIYVLERLHREDGEDNEARLALHFDQTVPLARYVAQHFNDLVFPFKRYQMQRVWRGERPQAGRFREFYQCDIDVINVDNLPMHFDAEMPAIIWEVLTGLPGMENEKIQLRISNRKIVMGMIETLGSDDPEYVASLLRIIDKREKMSPELYENEVREAIKPIGVNDNTNQLFKLIMVLPEYSAYMKTLPSVDEQIAYLEKNYGVGQLNQTFMQGIEELTEVLEHLKHLPPEAIVPDLSIVRGLDYYTGTVYETVFVDDPGYGSICSGGRYDDLASSYINKSLPGVGISIGFSRLFDRLRQKGSFTNTRKSPADVLMVLPNEAQRATAAQTARILRERGFKVELYHAPQKIGKQMSYAERKGIPYVWFPPFEDGQEQEVKSMETGEQVKADPSKWSPDKEKKNEAA